ncbi:MAG: UDP-2,3-diacylglucosamine diphosphatase [Bacteroidetes bacterium]|nr:UDP-2,3-diacylglucosamine diphosphatase [Bacteroidota bacterium]
MTTGKKIYFLSDFHLGTPDAESSLAREKKIVDFLNSIRHDAAMIFIVGDMFDFWFEYRKVVPKGFVRLLGKLAELSDAGISISFFVGNHDMWMRSYFQEELGIPVYFEPKEYELMGKRFLVGHGDGLGPGDYGYKLLKKLFRNPLAQWLFGILPPSVGLGIANYYSRRSRAATGAEDDRFLGEENEWLLMYCKEVLQKDHFDFFVFGHRHLPIDFLLNPGASTPSRYLNLGDWIRYDSYVEFDGVNVVLKYYKP